MAPSEADRSAVRKAYRIDEEVCVATLLPAAALGESELARATATATQLVDAVRSHKASGLDAFLHAYDLTSDEGIALMCLAEALLRVPDSETVDKLIHDKLSGPNWRERLTDSDSTFVNAATFGLMLTGEVLELSRSSSAGWRAAIGRAVGRLGEPVIRESVAQAMRILGNQFVFARTIDEAMNRAGREEHATHSFDMLGEAAKTYADARRYLDSYRNALSRIVQSASGGPRRSAGMSIKLSALHPRYEYAQADRVKKEILGDLIDLAREAERGDVTLTIDAEEADRLELSMDIIEAIARDARLFKNGWEGFGLALQAYQKRALPLTDWVCALAADVRARLMVRLVKGAYWDTEIKFAQVNGFSDYPVFTQKAATDVSYLACARRLFAAQDRIYPAFATHNAFTIGAVKAMAANADFEFQRLHGMGEVLYDALTEQERASGGPLSRVRIYAPVGSHKELLAYLVRRLLENGANSSFVNRIADSEVDVSELVADPVTQLAESRRLRSPAIPTPPQLFAPERKNSAGVDLSDPAVRTPLLARLEALRSKIWEAGPGAESDAQRLAVRSPQSGELVGHAAQSTPRSVAQSCAVAAAAQQAWCDAGAEHRAGVLERAADLFERETDAILSLCVREAGKTLPDAVLELREAVDFLRYYATEARRLFASPTPLPGPTGEQNELRLVGRGVFAAISPWNFPLAIFTGTVSAPLAAGNSVIAKPAEQTPLIAALAVDLMHEAGVPKDVLHLALGDGAIGAALVADENVGGVVFTGSTSTAKAIQRTLAAREGMIVPLIAETGGQNALIVDSSALPEQVTRDVLSSAFQSAGQRCSALRVLFLQEDIADGMIEMIAGAMDTLTLGNPGELSTDVGPVIDAEAKIALDAHVAALGRTARRIKVLDDRLPNQGTFVAPALFEIDGIAQLDREHFGPILHVVRYKASELDAVLDAIAATGYGLTLGLHSRIDETRRHVERRARVGNIYVNRNQIGAVVGSQPFGGEGLSGTGPKAGGPNYVARFATERTVCIDTTAAGGNATLMRAAG